MAKSPIRNHAVTGKPTTPSGSATVHAGRKAAWPETLKAKARLETRKGKAK